MIILGLKGGLGNQLFQYAAARSLASIHKTIVKLDTTAYYYGGPRQYELCHFNIQGNIAQSAEILNFTEVKQNRLQKIFHLIIHNRPAYSKHYFQYNKAQYYKNFNSLPDNIYLDGYFESEKYFIDIADIIRKEFTVKSVTSVPNQKIIDDMTSCQSVCISVRRGDFVTDPKANLKHGVCNLDYYYNCVERLAVTVKNAKFFVFSDDIEWCINNIKLNYPTKFIDHQQESPCENLRLITFCKHFIISNSTFSWWGAWLAPYKYKIVFVPKKWFADSAMKTNSLIPDKWIKI